MRRTTLGFTHTRWGGLIRFAAVTVIVTGCILTGWILPAASAQEKGQKTFASAEDACHALVVAIQRNNDQAILDVLGQDGKQIVSTGDGVDDQQRRENFLQKYEQMHRLVREPDGTTTLYIGAENWPTPIPLVSKGRVWYFDTDAAKKEILFRRIGWNELSTIRVCEELVAAQKEYYAMRHKYAAIVFSDEGQHDGLYWKDVAGEPQSPIGPLVAWAVVEGTPTPYRGYYYHILARQGKDAPGGAKSYVVSGNMTRGFAFVAYPAEYRSSGVMTFIVSEDGVVFQKDLGKQTAVLAKAMKEYDPSSSWQKAAEVGAIAERR
jgi:hypothetical protein